MTKNFDLFVESFIKSFEELPALRPYGFWINPNGKIYSVSSMNHSNEARNIINYFEPNLKKEYKEQHNIKDFLVKKGFLRTVFMGDEMLIDSYYYDSEKGKYIYQKPTDKAKRTARDIAMFYNYKPFFTNMG